MSDVPAVTRFFFCVNFSDWCKCTGKRLCRNCWSSPSTPCLMCLNFASTIIQCEWKRKLKLFCPPPPLPLLSISLRTNRWRSYVRINLGPLVKLCLTVCRPRSQHRSTKSNDVEASCKNSQLATCLLWKFDSWDKEMHATPFTLKF